MDGCLATCFIWGSPLVHQEADNTTLFHLTVSHSPCEQGNYIPNTWFTYFPCCHVTLHPHLWIGHLTIKSFLRPNKSSNSAQTRTTFYNYQPPTWFLAQLCYYQASLYSSRIVTRSTTLMYSWASTLQWIHSTMHYLYYSFG
jgi:hypothetical protein